MAECKMREYESERVMTKNLKGTSVSIALWDLHQHESSIGLFTQTAE